LAAARRPRLILEIDVGECLPVGVADDEAGVGFFDGPARREAARGGHEGKIIASAAGRTSG
jgi:hypothetical protein